MSASKSRRTSWFPALIAAGVLVAAMPVQAADPMLPPEITHGGIAYRNGGIGEDEAQAMRKEAPSYPLQIELLKKADFGRSAFLAGETVVIRDAGGKTVLEVDGAGPFVLVRLPDGRYTVTATHAGMEKKRNVSLAKGARRHLIFQW